MDKVKRIKEIKKSYYRALNKYFINAKPSASTDDKHIEENFEIFNELYIYFEDYLCQEWDWAIKYDIPIDADFSRPYIGQFIGYRVMKRMYNKIHQYRLEINTNINMYLIKHAELFKAIVPEYDPDLCVHFTGGSGLEFYKGNPIYGDAYIDDKESIRLAKYFYDLVLEEIDG